MYKHSFFLSSLHSRIGVWSSTLVFIVRRCLDDEPCISYGFILRSANVIELEFQKQHKEDG